MCGLVSYAGPLIGTNRCFTICTRNQGSDCELVHFLRFVSIDGIETSADPLESHADPLEAGENRMRFMVALYTNGSNSVARPGRNVVRARRSGMRLDFGPPQDDEADEQFEAHMSAIHAALDAAVDIEDYAEAQRLKVIMWMLRRRRASPKAMPHGEAAAAATFTTSESPVPPTSMESFGGFRYDTRSTRSVAAPSNAMSSQVRVDDECGCVVWSFVVM